MVSRAVFAALAAGCLLWNLLPPPPSWVERWYSRGLQPQLSRVLIPVADFFPFSLGALLCAGLPAAGLALAIASGLRARRRGVSFRRLTFRWAGIALRACVILYAWFLISWGAGYRRVRLDERLALGDAPPRQEDIEAWVSSLSRTIWRDLPPPGARPELEALASIRESLQDLIEEWDGRRPQVPRRLKRLPPGTLLASGTVGILLPFFLEAHVDAGDGEVGRLQVAGHELAHAAGLCSEADADLAGALAGLRARHPYARYAAALSIFRDFSAHLPESARVKAHAGLPPEAAADLRRIAEIRKSYRAEKLARVGRRVYDSYLKSHGLEDGVKEYGRLVELLVRSAGKGIVALP